MSDRKDSTPGEQAQAVGFLFAFFCGGAAWLTNGLAAAIVAAIIGYAAGRVVVMIFHTARLFLISGLVLVVLVLLFSSYLARVAETMG